jgi:hypothetical protein
MEIYELKSIYNTKEKTDEDVLETLGEDLPALLPHAQNCQTILAWDLERAGYLARIFAHLGWIPEKETFGWLKKTAFRQPSRFCFVGGTRTTTNRVVEQVY